MGTPGRKFEIIRDITEDPENVLNIKDLCEIAGVSRSGYYNWLTSETRRQEKEEQDRKDFDIILQAYLFRGYDKGVKGIRMRLLHLSPPLYTLCQCIRLSVHDQRCLYKADPSVCA